MKALLNKVIEHWLHLDPPGICLKLSPTCVGEGMFAQMMTSLPRWHFIMNSTQRVYVLVRCTMFMYVSLIAGWLGQQATSRTHWKWGSVFLETSPVIRTWQTAKTLAHWVLDWQHSARRLFSPVHLEVVDVQQDWSFAWWEGGGTSTTAKLASTSKVRGVKKTRRKVKFESQVQFWSDGDGQREGSLMRRQKSSPSWAEEARL